MATKITQYCDCELLCPECGRCLKECCECYVCSECGDRVDTNNSYWCSDCDKCENCDECRTCSNCDSRVSPDDFCGECDCCNECCGCTFCHWCGGSIDTEEEVYCKIHTNHADCCRKIGKEGKSSKFPCSYQMEASKSPKSPPTETFDLNPEEELK